MSIKRTMAALASALSLIGAALTLRLAHPVLSMTLPRATVAQVDRGRETDSATVASAGEKSPPPAPDADRSRDSDSISSTADYRQRIFSDTPTGRKVSAFIASLNEIGENAGRHYQQTFDEMNADPNATRELLRAYDRLGERVGEQHYKMVYALSELRSPDALPLFTRIATSLIPSQAAVREESAQSQATILLQMRATDGLRNLAADGNVAAAQTLAGIVRDATDATVRGQAIVDYLAVSSNLDRDIPYLKSMLPESLHYLVTRERRGPAFPAASH